MDQAAVRYVIISHGPRHYVGETVTMAGGRALVSARASEDLRALVIESEALRRVIATEAELGEKLLLSFILRRKRMVAEGHSEVRLIGDFRQAGTMRLQSFLSRNGIPFDVLDVSAGSQLLDDQSTEHSLTHDDLPVVISNGAPLVRPSNRTLAENLGFTVDIDFIGAQPGTAALGDQIALDEKGFVLTGDSLNHETLSRFGWPLPRRPYLLETSCPRVFAAGDVRAGSIKRVASAVGEGSVCIQLIHNVLAEVDEASA